MKIIYIAPYPPEKDGIGNYTKRTVDDFRSRGKDVAVISNIKDGLADEKDLYRLMSYHPLYILKFIIKLFALRPNIVHLQYTVSLYGFYSFVLYFALFLLRITTNTKLIVTMHEVKRETDLLKTPGVFFYKFFLMPFDLVYVHTHEAQDILRNVCFIPPEKVKVIPHGLYTFSSAAMQEVDIDALYGIKKRYILFFGYIHIHKGIEYLIDAYNILYQKDPDLVKDIELVIAGEVRERTSIFKFFGNLDKSYKKLLIDKVKGYNLVDKIRFIGYVDDKHVYSFIKKSFCIVLPYIKTEQSGVLNTAINANKPIIASGIGGLKETLEDTGLLVPPYNSMELANKLEKLIVDHNYYEQKVATYATLQDELKIDKINDNIFSNYLTLTNGI